MTNRIVETIRKLPDYMAMADDAAGTPGHLRLSPTMLRQRCDLAANAIEKGLVWHADQTKPGYCAPSCHDLAQALDAIAREGA